VALVHLRGLSALTGARQDLTTAVARFGGVSLQLAGTPDRAAAIVASWNAQGLMGLAWRSLQSDDRCIPCYSTLLGFACLMVGPPWGRGAVSVGLAWAMWLAAACDYGENTGLAQMQRGNTASPVPELTTACSAVKWLLIAVGLVFALGGALAGLTHRSVEP
jgi:hypothetical protein